MNGLDEARFQEVAQTTAAAVEAAAQRMRQLASAEVDGHSPDRRVLVRMTASGHITGVRLRDDVLARYGSSALGDLVTRTIQQTQRAAREAYEREVAAITPPEIVECERLLDQITRA